ncbi:MAG: metalloregulator ArsR/SmtB family transcription factor [Gammaproteobacteria bacterium]|jgi:DNA-binding transcriptional ArsR family regulator
MIQRRQLDIFHAVADPTRRRLLDLLAAGEQPVQKLVPQFDMSFQAVSLHLKVLAEAGLVSRRKAGRFRYYKAEPQGLREVYDWVSRYQRFWEARLDRLGTYLAKSELE